jgi:Uma2 family endonuclease
MAVLTHPPISPFETPPEFVWRFSVDDYHQLIAIGVLDEDDRVELLEGWLVPKMTHNPLHDGTLQLINKRLARRLPPQWDLRIQSAVTTDDSEPEPDVAIVRGDEQTYLQRHPGPADIGLIVEVAESSLEQDRKQKARLYARAGIPCYWLVNLVDRQVEVFTDPTGPCDAPQFSTTSVCRGEDSIPLNLDGQLVANFRAAELLPG